MTFTKERLEQLADDEKWVKATHSEVQELARIALASLEPAKCGHVDLDCDDGKAVCLHCGKTWEI